MGESEERIDLEAAVAALQTSPDYQVQRRLRVPTVYGTPDPDDEVLTGIILDTETTGLDAVIDHVIEIGVLPFTFSKEGQLFSVGTPFQALQEPPQPLDPEITRVTGLTDADLADQSIDIEALEAMIEPASLIIAHHAFFDRPFAERLSPAFETKAWACSMENVDWKFEGINSLKLEWIAYKLGYFFQAHRAVEDCCAVLELLSLPLPVSNTCGFEQLLATARKPTIRFWALNSPFHHKEALKRRGYRWNSGEDGRRKAWYRDVTCLKAEEEEAWLTTEIYAGNGESIDVTRITPFERYSNRV
jgi:DNA polymerase-3 subunit epsilon